MMEADRAVSPDKAELRKAADKAQEVAEEAQEVAEVAAELAARLKRESGLD